MAKRHYETTILVNAGQARADYDGTIAKVRAHFEIEGAEWLELEKWEERRLAYPIGSETSALYLNGYFIAEPASIEVITRRLELADEVLRHLIVARPGKEFERIKAQRAKAAERAARMAEEAAAAIPEY